MIALTVASLGARLALAVTRPPWFDELFTAWAARLPFRDLIAALRVDSGPPGFYVLEKAFVWLSESGVTDDRVLRVLPFLATAALFAAARSLPEGIARSTFLVLLSGSLLINLYAGEARAYALIALVDLALYLSALRGSETRGRLLVAAVAAALAPYIHYLGIFAVGAAAILAAVNRRWRSLAAVAAGAALFLPWTPVLRAQPAAAIGWMRENASASMLGFLSALGGVGRLPGPFGLPPSRPVFVASVAAGLLAAGALAFGPARKNREIRNAAMFTALVLAGALGAGLWRPVAFAGRTEMAVLPVWLWGLSLAAVESPVARVTSVATAALGACATISVLFSPRPASAPLETAENLSRVARKGDVVVAATGFYLPARLAAERGRLAARVVPLPRDLAEHPGWFDPALPGEAEALVVARAAATLPPNGRLFLAMPPVYATPGLVSGLGGASRLKLLTRARDALVVVWSRPPVK